MKKKLVQFIQNFGHDIENEDAAEEYIAAALPLIGMVVMSFNSLEKSLDSMICETITDRTDEPGLIVLQGMHFSNKVDLFKRLAAPFHKSLSTPHKYEGLIDKLSEMARLRNLVVHADWRSTNEEGFTYFRIKSVDGGLMQEYVQLTPESFDKLIDQMIEANHHLSDYWIQRGNLLSYGKSDI